MPESLITKIKVFDIEANGLNPDRIYCLSVRNPDGSIVSYTDYEDMRRFFATSDAIAGHNIVRYDLPVCERILGIKINSKLIVDTLPISWYIYTERNNHGLEDWGEHFGRPKVKIDDWDNLPIEEYISRCEGDVEINTMLWNEQLNYLSRLYEDDSNLVRILGYLTFKMQQAALQEASRWRLDIDRCMDGLDTLRREREEKLQTLQSVMPKVPTKSVRKKPKAMYKQDGTLSALGVKWVELLDEHNLPRHWTHPVEVITGYKEPNPGSNPQIKSWLFSLGWKPNEFKFVRDKNTNELRKIEQINKQTPGEVGVTDSIKELYSVCPELENLDGLSIITHRIGILAGFLENVDDEGYIKAQIQGLTNTLRFKHRVAVNLPGVDKPYGELIRGCLIAPEGCELAGSDMSGLEDRTKQHYMWDHDPEYVTQMLTPDFDPHLDIGLESGIMTSAMVSAYRSDKSFSDKRHTAKTANYACTYGASAERLSRESGMPLADAKKLHEAYWRRNWAIVAIAKSCVVKTVDGQMWLFNPISQLWYSLRHEKDKFSTLNQGSGVWCFDTWIKHILKVRPQLTGQFHDEIVLTIPKGSRDKCTKLLRWALDQTNKELRLNRELDIDIQFGENYAKIH